MKKPLSFLAKTSTLFGIPAIALAQSKSPGTPTIPLGPALSFEPSTLSGSVTFSGSAATSPLPLSFVLTPTKWETSSAPASPTCTVSQSTAVSSSKNGMTTSSTSNPTYAYSCSLGSITKNTTYSAATSAAGSWSGQDDIYSLSSTNIDLSSLPSTTSQQSTMGKSSSTTQRNYTLNLSVTKSGFSFDEKVKKTILCAEQVAGVAFDVNVASPTIGYIAKQAAGTFTHYAATSTTPELGVAYYASGWQFAIATPRPGKVVFRTPESAKSALTTKTVTTNSSFGKSTTPTTSTVITDDLSKGWFELASMETVNSSYCKAW